MKSSTQTLIGAMRVLAGDIQGGDGTANAAILEAAERLEELDSALSRFVKTPESEKAVIYDEVIDGATDEQKTKMKYHESPFHSTHDKDTADAMCKAFNPKP